MNSKLPVLTGDLIHNIMLVLCESNSKQKKCGRPPKEETNALKDTLTEFHFKHYQSTMTTDDVLTKVNMDQILKYTANEIVTVYVTNIQQHFITYLERFIEILFGTHLFKQQRREISKNTSDSTIKKQLLQEFDTYRKEVYHQIQEIVHNICICQEITDDRINQYLKYLIPNRKINKSIYYDLRIPETVQDYLPCMIYIMRFIEDKGLKTLNVFPMRTDVIPKYIKLDTVSVMRLLCDNQSDLILGTKTYLNSKLSNNQDNIWNYFFRTNMKCFRGKHYDFKYSILTDGVACSILQISKEVCNLETFNELYIDKLPDYSKLQGKKIVGIDPNKGDLIYCTSKIYTSNIDPKLTVRQNKLIQKRGYYLQIFRYTQNQRRVECSFKRNREIRRVLNKEQATRNSVNGILNANKTIQELQTELSFFNHKTLKLDEFKKYLCKKNEVNAWLLNHYNKEDYRKMKWNTYMNKQRSEANLIKNFKKVFGEPDTIVIGFGNWSSNTHHMKYHEPTKSKGFRKLFRKAGYPIYLVDEFRTSKKCYNCQSTDPKSICKYFKLVKNPRPWKRNELVPRHGLLMCKTCRCLWNRDLNSSLNIHRIVECVVAGLSRPAYLQR